MNDPDKQRKTERKPFEELLKYMEECEAAPASHIPYEENGEIVIDMQKAREEKELNQPMTITINWNNPDLA